MNFEQAQRSAEVLAEVLDSMAATVESDVGLPDEAAKLRRRATEVRDGMFKVVVVGEFKRGKSTLLNALLGAAVLPQKVAPCTAVVTVIQYADAPEVRIVFNDGAPEEVLDLDGFRKRYELQVDDAQGSRSEFDRFSRVDHAVIRYPVELCRKRVELVDSPGLGEHRTRTERTVSFLDRADAVVMVLDATQLLKLEETHFLEHVLLPRGLKNIFFVVNKWNLIEEAVLHPEELDQNYADLDNRLRSHLGPFCVIQGQDRSSERIFRVDARGALKARLKSPPLAAQLEASNVPAFEAALQRFLVDDRFAARTEVVLATMRATVSEIGRYLDTQLGLANKTLEELERERAQIQPKLDRLRGIRKHVEGYLDSQSSILQDRLVNSFIACLRRIEDDLPNVVQSFDLSGVTGGVMIWKVLQDQFSAEKKFAKTIERELLPQIQRHLEVELGKWHQSVAQNELRSVAVDVEKFLFEEAQEYHRVLREIDERLGVRDAGLDIEQLVRHWLSSDSQDGRPISDFKGLELGVMADFSFLVGTIAADLVIEVVAHVGVSWIPVVGLFITGTRLWMREMSIRAELEGKLVEGIRSKLGQLRDGRGLLIREDVRNKFRDLRERISGNMGEEISLIEASLKAVIDRRKRHEQLRDSDRKRLEDARDQVRSLFQQALHGVVAPPAETPSPAHPAGVSTTSPTAEPSTSAEPAAPPAIPEVKQKAESQTVAEGASASPGSDPDAPSSPAAKV